ncbi:trichohyalin-like [Xiphias gladius]|uniref:trichohyalin-like n=1 Tax=Xiphias gladius TaxID=8245 RepID=UPI001A99B10C|nr:trichohyalin-like [Xiphias gladius]
MSKKQRWHETLVNSKTNTPTPKKGGKDLAALTVPVSSGGRQAGSSTSKPGLYCGRSNSPSSRGSELKASGSKVGGSLKRGSLGQQGSAGHQGTRQASHPGKPALRLCSSRSFSSLHTSSLTAAPFMRSSRSLSRLDQRTTGQDSDHAVPSLQVKKGQASEKKVLYSGRLWSSEEQIRDNKDQCHGDNAEKMKISSSSEPPESSSSLVSSTACHLHCNKVKEQTTDGVYTLCAMTSGMRRDCVQAVLKNVRPDVTSSLSEQKTQQKSHQPDSESAEVVWKSEHPDSCLQEHKTSEWAEDSHQQQKDEDTKLQPEKEQSSAVGNSAPTPIIPPHQVEEGDSASCHQCPLLVGTAQTARVTTASKCVEGAGSHSSISTAVPSIDNCFDEHSNMGNEIQQSWQEAGTTPESGVQQVSRNTTCECAKDRETLLCEQQTGQLVKELEQTQKELSRLQQLNRNLQDELQIEKESHSGEWVCPQKDLLSNSLEQASALQRLQKINHGLRIELEAQKRSQEEAREAELRRRVDLLAQQAQLLVTGDATALAQAHLEQDRRRFQEQQMELEHCVSSLKSQLSTSEAQRREAESRLTQLQQELQSYHNLQQEADRLQGHLHEVKTQLCENEEAQAQKEARLQKHLMLLQASQDRERRSLAASLAQAEQHSQDLQERLDRAEQQVESLNQTQTWTREIAEAQQQLQEELSCTVSAVQKLQEEREQLDRRCQKLQNQLSEANGEVTTLQSRLKTEETHYYNLEHSYERVCEELQLALGKVQQRDTETQDIREGYERLLDMKEQELSEVLLKMEVLGNSLEETEVRLNEVLKVCNCACSQLKPKAVDSGQLSKSSNAIDLVQGNVNHSDEHARNRSCSIDASYQCIVTAGDDPERFMSVIQLLETKLYVTEEKLRDITERLEEHQSHISCQDPHLCSQLTQSRATAQHLSLLLHSQAKQSQRFAQETENRCRMFFGRFQVALNIIQACRERLQVAPISVTDFEKQLATVAACLQQGQKDAEKQQHESHKASKGEDKILNDETLAGADSSNSAKSKLTNTLPSEDDMASVRNCLMRELFVVEKMLSVLQSQHGIGQLSLAPREDERDVAHRYKSIISQRIALKKEKRTQSGRAECDGSEPLESAIGGVCAEAELIYAALKFQQQYESQTQANNQDVECKKKALADISPPELAPYEEQVKVEGRGLEEATKPVKKDQSDDKKEEAEKEPEWLERLISRLQRRAKFLNQLCKEISDGQVTDQCLLDYSGENDSAKDGNWMQEQAKLIYLSDRLHLDLEQELQRSEVLQNKLRAFCKEQDTTLMDEQEALNPTLCQLQEDNSVLREELERAEQKIISVETGNQRLLEDIKKIENYHEERMQKLETKFQEKLMELQQIHEEEMKHLHGYYTKEKQTKTCTEAPAFTESNSSPLDRVLERKTKEELGNWMVGGDAVAAREAHQKDLEKLEDRGFPAMEATQRKLIGDLQQQQQMEAAALLKERDQLLQEETAATMAAILAMRRAHKQELEKSGESQHLRESADITQLQDEYEKEIQLSHKEPEVLSAQHTQKCLESSHLSQELQDERKSPMQYQKENQELKKKQRQTDEMSQLHFSLNGKQSHVAAETSDFYEMEVILRAREAEMQFLRQEACSLSEELKIAQMDKIYAQNKLKALYTNRQGEPHHEVKKLRDDFKFATWSPGRDASGPGLKDSMTNTSNAAFLKKTEKSSLMRQIRGVRSKSLKEGLSVQERMKLFESF